MVSKSKTLVLYILPMISGSISFIASGTITVMILLSQDRFKTPYRRILFGLSVADTIQSLAMVLGPFAIPKGTEGALWALGNTSSCDAQGFAVHVGFAGVPMYTLCLCLYYYYMIKMNMSDRDFAKKVEPYLHAGAIVWTFVGGFICLSSGSFNVLEAGNMCWYTPLPADCVRNDDVECVRGSSAFTYGWIFGGSNFLTLCGIIYCLFTVCRSVIVQEKKNDRYRFRGSISVPQEPQGPLRRVSVAYSSFRDSSSTATFPRRMSRALSSLRGTLEEDPEDPLAIYRSRSIRKSMKRRREAMKQAVCYIGAFLWTCIWAYLYGFLVTVGIGAPYAISVLLVLFYPLGGFLNLLVYTRPKVRSVRKRIKDLSWIRAFIYVVRAGGNLPDDSVLQSVSDERGSSNMQPASQNLRGSMRNSDASGTPDEIGPNLNRLKRGSRVSFKSNVSEEEKEELQPPRKWRFQLPRNAVKDHVEGCASLDAEISDDRVAKEPFLPKYDGTGLGASSLPRQNNNQRSIMSDSNQKKENDIEDKVSSNDKSDNLPSNHCSRQGDDTESNYRPIKLPAIHEATSGTAPLHQNKNSEGEHSPDNIRSLTSTDPDFNNRKIEKKDAEANPSRYDNDHNLSSNHGDNCEDDDTGSNNVSTKLPDNFDAAALEAILLRQNNDDEEKQNLDKIRSLMSVHSPSNHLKMEEKDGSVGASTENDNDSSSNHEDDRQRDDA